MLSACCADWHGEGHLGGLKILQLCKNATSDDASFAFRFFSDHIIQLLVVCCLVFFLLICFDSRSVGMHLSLSTNWVLVCRFLS